MPLLRSVEAAVLGAGVQEVLAMTRSAAELRQNGELLRDYWSKRRSHPDAPGYLAQAEAMLVGADVLERVEMLFALLREKR